jgi:hypothetical protein
MTEKKVNGVFIGDGANLSKLGSVSTQTWVEKGANLSRLQTAATPAPAVVVTAPSPKGND